MENAGRRRKGSGSIFQRADGLWVGRAEEYVLRQRKRRQVTSARFCELLRKFSEMHPYRPEFSVPAAPRSVAIRAAREQGRHTASEWHALVRSVSRACAYCGITTTSVRGGRRTTTKDHIIPVTRGGSDAIENIAVACRQCNSEKGTLTADEFRQLARIGKPRLLP